VEARATPSSETSGAKCGLKRGEAMVGDLVVPSTHSKPPA